MPPEPCIVVDATFPWRIAGELRSRGMNATSPHELGNQGMKDPILLKLISYELEPAVLVTFDNKMPVEHRALLDRYATTLAVVQNVVPDGLTLEEYWRDVIHHHAHRFAVQAKGSLFRYARRARRRIP